MSEARHSGAPSHKRTTARKASRSFSRRKVLAASILGGLGLAGSSTLLSLGACSKKLEEQVDQPLVIDKSEYNNLLDFTNIDPDFKLLHTADLPLGSVLHMSAERYVAVLERSTEQMTISHLGVFDSNTAQYHRVLDKPQRAEEGRLSYSLYDVRCSDSLMAWIEINYESYDWALYAASLDEGVLSKEVVQLVEGNKDIMPPEFIVYQNSVVWQEIPHPDGAKKTENSKAFLWNQGAQEAGQLISSNGQFGCRLHISGSVLSLCPRQKIDESNYYVIYAYDLAAQNKELARLVMPKNVRPTTALYADGKFCITIEASYNYGGLLGHMGSYVGTGLEGEKFYACLREPYTAISMVKDRVLIKNRASILVFDLSDQTYFRLAASNNALDWGEFCAQPGLSSKVVSYSTVKSEKNGLPEKVVVRVFEVPDNVDEQRLKAAQERAEAEARAKQEEEALQPLEGAEGSRLDLSGSSTDGAETKAAESASTGGAADAGSSTGAGGA